MLAEDKVIVELKSVEKLAAAHGKQVLTQLRLSERRLGRLINFGEVHLKNGIERIVNGLPAETPPSLGHKLLSFFASLAPFACLGIESVSDPAGLAAEPHSKPVLLYSR